MVVAGAGGFVGRWLCAALRDRGAEVVGLGRSVEDGVVQDGVTWRRCDLFNLLACERALEGADFVVYLVHSMQPSARLTQASFEDMDLILADNIARASASVGARRIVYLGGLIPQGAVELSRHLASRREVESALGGHGVPVTSVRAGLVLGPGGSSFDILRRLVERLPAMILPPWTRTPTQPVWIEDVVAVIVRLLEEGLAVGGSVDVGCPQVMTYRALIERMSAALGVSRRLVDVPFGPVALSELWVSLVTGTPRALVAPLVESLTHPMVARDRDVQLSLGVPGLDVDTALRRALQPPPARLPTPPRAPAEPRANTVRSVQRLRLPAGRDADWAAQEYLAWLPHGLWPMLQVVRGSQDTCSFRVRGLGLELLRLRYAPERSTADRALLYVVGGVLATTGGPHRGRLELRASAGGDVLLAAIHDYVPSLPWPVYLATQALAHLLVMKMFGWHLAQVSQGAVPSLDPS